ncbi:hypothetical protein GHK03_32035 [Sinorhizobium medicae]|uniref:hypothetical protein n=1 Tax=Sinorhizobium medicae TaxID=110321 RepID=UPI001296A6C8|nr:hypothetical protein [Sinorhizobium medicae]MQY00645.1 hypothetical protein [Sinorhizobium medicae]
MAGEVPSQCEQSSFALVATGYQLVNLFEHQLKNIPHLVDEERDAERYLRAFAPQ